MVYMQHRSPDRHESGTLQVCGSLCNHSATSYFINQVSHTMYVLIENVKLCHAVTCRDTPVATTVVPLGYLHTFSFVWLKVFPYIRKT